MGGYLLRRTLLAIPVIWGVVTLLFFALFVVPGDPVELLAGDKAVTTQVRANIEEKFGLDEAWYIQYGRYWGRLMDGDLGESYRTGRTVSNILAGAAPATIRLAFWAVVIEVAAGMGAGVLAMIRRSSLADGLVTVSTAVLLAVPTFVLGYLLIYMLGIFPFEHGFPDWARFPVQGIGPDTWALFVIPTGGQWRHLFLPAVTLGSVHAALAARMTRASMLGVLGADYMRTAAAVGVSPGRRVLRLALKNAMIPVVTLLGLDAASLMGGAVLTEAVFNWPGVGSTIATAAGFNDAPIVLGLSLVLVVTYVLIGLVVDLASALIDPRIRHGSGAGSE